MKIIVLFTTKLCNCAKRLLALRRFEFVYRATQPQTISEFCSVSFPFHANKFRDIFSNFFAQTFTFSIYTQTISAFCSVSFSFHSNKFRDIFSNFFCAYFSIFYFHTNFFHNTFNANFSSKIFLNSRI